MSALLLAVALGALPCGDPAILTLSEARQVEACALLAHRDASAVDRASLEAIYARPELARARQRNTGALKALLARLRAWLETLFESAGMETYSNVTRFVVLALGALLALGVALRLWSRRRGRARPPGAAPAAPAQALVLERPAVHLARARALLATAPREAIREGLLSLLSHLEEQRLARPDRVKTNHELAEELPARGASPELVAAIRATLGWYDEAFYSLEPVPPPAAARFLDEVTALGQRVAGGPR